MKYHPFGPEGLQCESALIDAMRDKVPFTTIGIVCGEIHAFVNGEWLIFP